MEVLKPQTPCAGCRDGATFTADLAMAFQPIVDLERRRIHAYEALVRGPGGESAQSILSQLGPENRYAFDQKCRVAAIEGAVAAGILEGDAKLSINFLPNSVYSPIACIRLTLETAKAVGFPTGRLIFEFTEDERMLKPNHVADIVAAYRKMGFATALDDFGAGYAGLSLLAAIQPDIIKLDMQLIRDVDTNAAKRTIVGHVVQMGAEMGIQVIAEGVETMTELAALHRLGVQYFQGHFFARPSFRALGPVTWPVGIAVPPDSYDQPGNRRVIPGPANRNAA